MKIKYTNILIYEHDELKYTINYKKMKGFEFMTSDNIEVYHKNETFYIQDKTYDQSYLMGSFKSKESLRAGFSFAILKIEKEPELVTLITLGVVGIINLKKYSLQVPFNTLLSTTNAFRMYSFFLPKKETGFLLFLNFFETFDVAFTIWRNYIRNRCD